MRRDSPGQGTAPSPVCADKNSLPGTFPAGCLCHFRRGLCHGADCSPESTGCDSQLTFSINLSSADRPPELPGGRSFLWGGFLLYWSQRMGAGTMMRNMRLGLAILAAVLTITPEPGTRWCAVLTRRTVWIGAKLCGCGAKKDRGRKKAAQCRSNIRRKTAQMGTAARPQKAEPRKMQTPHTGI